MPHILIVEDDLALREALETTLKAEGFNIATAGNGEEGLARIAAQKPDLILLDIVMPKMDGLTMMHRLHSEPGGKDIPIIFLTNLSDVETISQVVKEGVFDYVVKSEWDINKLVELVKKRLRKMRA